MNACGLSQLGPAIPPQGTLAHRICPVWVYKAWTDVVWWAASLSVQGDKDSFGGSVGTVWTRVFPGMGQPGTQEEIHKT